MLNIESFNPMLLKTGVKQTDSAAKPDSKRNNSRAHVYSLTGSTMSIGSPSIASGAGLVPRTHSKNNVSLALPEAFNASIPSAIERTN